MRFKVVDEYNKREQEIKHLEKELEEKSNNLNAYRQKISEVWGLLGWSVDLPRTAVHSMISYVWQLCVSCRLKSVGWTHWSCWWNRSTTSSATSSAPCSAQEKWICTQRTRLALILHLERRHSFYFLLNCFLFCYTPGAGLLEINLTGLRFVLVILCFCFDTGGVWQVRDPYPSQVSQPHAAPRADGAPSEWRRAQRLHHALPHGPAGTQPLPLQGGRWDQPGETHTQSRKKRSVRF